MPACRICGNTHGNQLFEAREMMLGLREPFRYVQCAGCGCLQLATVPADWSRYYPRDYYSFEARNHNPALRLLKRLRARPGLGGDSLVGRAVVRVVGAPRFVDWLKPVGLRWNDAILDVGSGAGQLLVELSIAGFTNLTGVDPNVPGDRQLNAAARVLKKNLHELEGSFDFVMMNHSFEHFEDPEVMLTEVARLLPAGRLLMIRIPVAGCHAWRTYGTDWVQLDAPRHVFIHSEESIRILARRCGFCLQQVQYDSGALQFWASEQYRQDLPLRDPRSHLMNPRKSRFTRKQLTEYERLAADLNRRGDGDQACFYLRREAATAKSLPARQERLAS